jgi:hypothetical protein
MELDNQLIKLTQVPLRQEIYLIEYYPEMEFKLLPMEVWMLWLQIVLLIVKFQQTEFKLKVIVKLYHYA